jgi:hypothetical protein
LDIVFRSGWIMVGHREKQQAVLALMISLLVIVRQLCAHRRPQALLVEKNELRNALGLCRKYEALRIGIQIGASNREAEGLHAVSLSMRLNAEQDLVFRRQIFVAGQQLLVHVSSDHRQAFHGCYITPPSSSQPGQMTILFR